MKDQNHHNTRLKMWFRFKDLKHTNGHLLNDLNRKIFKKHAFIYRVMSLQRRKL